MIARLGGLARDRPFQRGAERRQPVLQTSRCARSARRGGTETLTGKEITAVAGAVDVNAVREVVAACKKNQVDNANRVIDSILKDGFPGLQVMTQFAETVVEDEGVADAVKGKICERIAEADKALVDGADETLQLMAIVSTASVAREA